MTMAMTRSIPYRPFRMVGYCFVVRETDVLGEDRFISA